MVLGEKGRLKYNLNDYYVKWYVQSQNCVTTQNAPQIEMKVTTLKNCKIIMIRLSYQEL